VARREPAGRLLGESGCKRPRDRAAGGAALAGQFESAHHVEGVRKGYAGFGFAEKDVADVGVVVAVIAGGGWDAAFGGGGAVGESEHTPIFFWFETPWTFRGNFSGAQVDFLGIESLFEEGAFGAEEQEAGALGGGENVGAEDGAHVVGIVEGDVESVVGFGAFAFGTDVGVDGLRAAEENHGVVDQVRSNVEQNAGAWNLLLAPGVGFEVGAETIVVGLEPDDAAEGVGGDELAKSGEVAVVAAILVDGEEAVGFIGEIDERGGFVVGSGEGLVDDDVAAGGEASAGEGGVSFVGRGDHDQANVGDGEEFVEGAHDASLRVGGGGFVAGALKDGGEMETGDGADDRGVKGATSQAVADERDINHGEAEAFRLRTRSWSGIEAAESGHRDAVRVTANCPL
jgi:hypothetical protein